jgi:hypothetical protein
MSDPAKAFRRSSYAVFIAAGLASSLLYLSIFLSFAFLLPVQIAFGRKGGRAGAAAAAAAAGISAAGITVAQVWRLAAAGAFGPDAGAGTVGLTALAAGILPPLVLLGALALLNASLWRRWAPVYRALCATALCALAALPFMLTLDSNTFITVDLEKAIGDVIVTPIRAAIAASGVGDGYDASALMASLDPKYLVAASIAMLRNSYAAILFFLLAGSWRLGNRLSGIGSRGREVTGAIDELRLPYPFVWAFLASWSLVLVTVLLHVPGAASAFAWNCALVVSLAYAAQGIGIVTHLFKSWNMPKSLRILMAVMAVISLATPIGIAVAASLPLFGFTEIWIHYRKPKGVGA